jgi:pimeloyl-ACP methyl ester carboxylesterase
VSEWEERELATTYAGVRKYQLENYYHGQWRPEYEPWARVLAGIAVGPARERWARVQALMFDAIVTQPVVYELDLLRPRTLLLIGELDRTAIGKDAVAPEVAAGLGDYPRLARDAAGRIPGATLVLLDGVGHIPHLEDYPRFLEAVGAFIGAPAAPTR